MPLVLATIGGKLVVEEEERSSAVPPAQAPV